MKKTSFLYILKEILPISFIGLMVFTIILLMDKILKLIELIVNRGGSLKNILMLFLFISPSFLTFTIPIAVLLGTLLTFGRLSGDSEITAFKASGISLYQLFLPVSLFAIFAFLLTNFMLFYGLPWGNRGFKATLYLLAQSKADIEIKERVFNDMFNGLVVYVDKVPVQNKKMEGILIYDERDKGKTNTIVAQEGFIVNNPETQEIILRLQKGNIQRYESRTNIFQNIQFYTYDFKLEVSRALAAIEKKLKDHEMSSDDIRAKIEAMKAKGEDPTSVWVDLHRRNAIPYTCLVFALIGVPLGIQPRRSAKSYGLVFSILIILSYYVSLIAFQNLAIRKVIPPFMAGWLPTFLFGMLGIYLFVKAANESPFKPVAWVIEGIDTLQRKWKMIYGDI